MHLWRNLKTVFQLAARVDDLEEQWTDVRLDLADRTDKLDKLLRRLTLRAERSESQAEIVAPAVTQEGNGGRKRTHEELRELARQRGLIR